MVPVGSSTRTSSEIVILEDDAGIDVFGGHAAACSKGWRILTTPLNLCYVNVMLCPNPSI